MFVCVVFNDGLLTWMSLAIGLQAVRQDKCVGYSSSKPVVDLHTLMLVVHNKPRIRRTVKTEIGFEMQYKTPIKGIVIVVKDQTSIVSFQE